MKEERHVMRNCKFTKGQVGIVTLVISFSAMVLFMFIAAKVVIEQDVSVEVTREMEIRTNYFNSMAALNHISNSGSQELMINYSENRDIDKKELKGNISEALYFEQGDTRPSEHKIEVNFTKQAVENVSIKTEENEEAIYETEAYIATPQTKPSEISVKVSGQ
jgi:hypothetical protein